MSDLTDLLSGIAKMTPAEGDIVVLRLKPDTQMEDIWPQLDGAADRGFLVLALTDDVQITTIKDTGSYVISFPTRVPAEALDRMRGEWERRFPNTTVSFLVGGEIQEVETDDNADTLL